MKLSAIFLWILIFVLLFFGGQVFFGYIANHPYYIEKITDGGNWGVLIFTFIASLIPVFYLFASKKFNFIKFLIYIILGLYFFGLLLLSVKEGIVGSGLIMLFVNVLILSFLILAFLLSTYSYGEYFKEKVLKLKTYSIYDIFLSFGVGLSGLLILIFILMSFNLLYPLVSYIIFIGGLVLAYYQKDNLILVKSKFEEILLSLREFKNKSKIVSYLGVFLLIVSILYFYFGFMLSFIPYPTAWDANHAYMFNPKVWAMNAGFYWGGDGPSASFQLWYSYITYWFSLALPLGSVLWISADSIATVTNFFSGVFVLLFFLALSKEVLNYFSSDETTDNADRSLMVFYFAWLLILLWLTSGMGAFLVFVDNKTDMGVLAIIILAMYSGFVGLKSVKDANKNNESVLQKYTLTKFGISGFLFAMAVMAKPTAFLDAVGFGLLLTWMWIGIIAVISVFFIIIGLLSFVEFRGIKGYITPQTGIFSFILGIVGFAGGTFLSFMKKSMNYFLLMLAWGGVFVASLLLFKGSFVLFEYHQDGEEFNIIDFADDVFLSYNSFSSEDEESKTQDKTKKSTLLASTQPVANTNSCTLDNYDEDDLYENVESYDGDTRGEDVGRYVGYGHHDFENPWWGMFFPRGDYCLGFNEDAKKVCGNFVAIAQNDQSTIENMIDQIEDDYLVELLEGQAQGENNTGDIQQYYQSYVMRISSDNQDQVVSIPYNYLVPFNLTFNWSLQNLSSYYTDVGYIWLILKFIMIVGLIYSLIARDRFLIGFILVSSLIWSIWFFIGGGILWYGIGLIVWTILSFILIFDKITRNINWDDYPTRFGYHTLVALFLIFGILGIVFNFIRISTQGGSGPFMWYKQSSGIKQTIDEQLQPQNSIKTPYVKEDIFDLQFGHYNEFIEASDSREEGEVTFIAGTYARYFLENQKYIETDQFLTDMWELFSDNDICKSYLRLKNEDIKYIAIDPNIGTVVMGDGNVSLFNRFFGEIEDDQIVNDGVMTMLLNLSNKGYIDHISSNNIGAKYAFELSDEELKLAEGVDEDNVDLIRAKISVPRYWEDNIGEYVNVIVELFDYRIRNNPEYAISDIASILGKQVDSQEVASLANSIMEGAHFGIASIENLDYEERNVLTEYLGLIELMETNQHNYSQAIHGLVNRSISGSSQIITLGVEH
ncbi:hypothetical protein [Candidatus Absconditicoccus praedator]|uniref:hypothetical protein n=1 Tax=Candidatus Absconditicoccus praedator TaxID=2735562 RepID=UPI001E2A8517|nr:hypothetical protein [Candidatus Absconditicoccus praedator]UFX83274.1 hypothetical protein HLG78_04045 [Candidatus Absconditicoccus praedator]